MYIKEKTLRENYKEAYKLWRERNPVTRMNMDAKALLNQKNYICLHSRRVAVYCNIPWEIPCYTHQCWIAAHCLTKGVGKRYMKRIK